MNNLNGSPGLTSISASQRAFATKGIIPDFKDCKWDYEADKDGFQEFAETFRTVIAARFPEAEIIHRHIDYHTGALMMIVDAADGACPGPERRSLHGADAEVPGG